MTIICTRYKVVYKNGGTDTIPAVVWTPHYAIWRKQILTYTKEKFEVTI